MSYENTSIVSVKLIIKHFLTLYLVYLLLSVIMGLEHVKTNSNIEMVFKAFEKRTKSLYFINVLNICLSTFRKSLERQFVDFHELFAAYTSSHGLKPYFILASLID